MGYGDPKPLGEGLFSDVSGTLLVEGRLNDKVYQILLEAAEKDLPVTIFTSTDEVNLTKDLRSLGVAETFLPVRSKSIYAGCDALIDDKPDRDIRERTQLYRHPNDDLSGFVDEILALMLKKKKPAPNEARPLGIEPRPSSSKIVQQGPQPRADITLE